MGRNKIRKNDGVYFYQGDFRTQGIVERIKEGRTCIRLDGYGGKVSYTALKKNGKWYAWDQVTREYVLEVFKI